MKSARGRARCVAALLAVLFATAIASLGEAQVAAGAPTLDRAGFEAEPMACCKVCKKGKACGNSCIAREKNCHQPPGCACDG
jgi:hypothetical protein